MPSRVNPLRLPSLRSWLIDVHRDLFIIDDFAVEYPPLHRLTTVEEMILILEDRRYFDHAGIDVKSFLREVIRATFGRKHGGASTIDMQFVRTATGYKHYSIKRKFYEIALSFIIQFRYNKIQIFRSYTECAFFGSGLRGLEAASWSVFGKSPGHLNIDEASYIAAMLVYPKPLSSNSQWEMKVRRRANYAVKLYPRHKERFAKLPSWEEA